MVTIYHNPYCSNSRRALEVIRAAGIEPEIIDYLKHPLSEEALWVRGTKPGPRSRDLGGIVPCAFRPYANGDAEPDVVAHRGESSADLNMESSVIQSMGYDGDLAVLEVEFVSGQLWRYHFIPHRIWTELRCAASKGAYFANTIREKFPATRVT